MMPQVKYAIVNFILTKLFFPIFDEELFDPTLLRMTFSSNKHMKFKSAATIQFQKQFLKLL